MATTNFSKNLSLSSSLKMGQEETIYKKQGIVSILGFDTEKEAKSTTPLRRTISADMSSRIWLEQNTLASPIKKVASTKEFQVCMDDDQDLEGPNQFKVWNSVQEAKLESKKQEKVDVWSCILTQKDDHTSKNTEPAPYVHPLVKKTTSSLSIKSLEVCTESLGSETGSDSFSYTTTKTQDDKEDQEKHSPTFDKEDFSVVKFHYADRKKVQAISFPPPLHSLSHGSNGSSQASLQMRPRRDNGRLVLEAVSVPSQNTFHAQRQDGRLVLSFADTSSDDEEDYLINSYEELEDGRDLEEIFPDFEQDEWTEFESNEEQEDEEEAEEVKEYIEYMMNVNRIFPMASKPMELVKRNQTWQNKFNEDAIHLAKSLPPRHAGSVRLIPKPNVAATKAGAAASLNAYGCCWSAKLNLHVQYKSLSLPLEEQRNGKFIVSKNFIANELLRGCRESRRSLLFLEPHCIPTS